MSYAVLGTGSVGQLLANKLLAMGHHVAMGARRADNEAATAWVKAGGERAKAGTFAQAAAEAEVVLLAVKGEHALAVVEAAGDALDGKVLVDITNPLDFSQGFPPRLSVCNDESLAEQIQAAVPAARVVKSLNTLAGPLMVDPGQLPEPTDVFVAGNDAAAKETVKALLTSMGHSSIVDLGGIDGARGLEGWLLLWTRLYGALGTAMFNLRLVRAEG
ncbi:MAG: NAD(P)-binding domain-containing protein [Myxococcales bacterium]|nr:NAD(P)-binding domain-containing protein [Myxococcales bacterium]